VKITFPRDTDEHMEASKTRDNLKIDEVLVKGGKKGVAGAKAEIMDVCIDIIPTSLPFIDVKP